MPRRREAVTSTKPGVIACANLPQRRRGSSAGCASACSAHRRHADRRLRQQESRRHSFCAEVHCRRNQYRGADRLGYRERTCAFRPTQHAGASAESRVSRATSPPSPQQVVSDYLDALNAHDIAQAKTYLTAQHAAEVAAETDSWFFNVRSITNVDVGSGAPRGAFGGPATGYSQIVQVGVRFTLAQYHAQSMVNGVNDWSYILVRNSDHDRWLIADEGMG